MHPTPSQALALVSRAWGQQQGYVFFPWIDGRAQDKAQRIRGYNEGPAFRWPRDKPKITEHLEAHVDDDLYWCPSIFEKPARKIENGMDEHALWADLDKIDPAGIDEQYKPTIAWETSPGRFQALWLITSGDVQGASWPGNENQRLTYYLGADHSGWDTTQLLRLPGWSNHKPEYRSDDGPPVGRLLWHKGPRYLPDHFDDLPAVERAEVGLATDVLEQEVERVDRHAVWGRVRLKCSKDVRDLVGARSTGGEDRSSKLWQIERDLADAGCSLVEIVAVVRETVWNKFSGRADELKRLVAEASKALGERSVRAEEKGKILEETDGEKARPTNLFHLVKDAEPPKWLVRGILTTGSCGFLAGEPKSYKSWVGLDLALSVATGSPFLQAFDVVTPGAVLYVQEEDPLPVLKDRLGKIAPLKSQDRVKLGDVGEDGVRSLEWLPAPDSPWGDDAPPVMALVRVGLQLSDPGWQSYLDEVLGQGYAPDQPYVLLLVDTLGTTMGDVDQNKVADLNASLLVPLRQLAEKHGTAVQLIHHLRKARENENARAGQRLLGSVALHAWSEASMYFSHTTGGKMMIETELKTAAGARFEIRNLRKRNAAGSLVWEPEIFPLDDEEPAKPSARARTKAVRSTNPRIGQGTRKKIAKFLDLPEDTPQAQVRIAWEAAGHTWNDWAPMGGIAARAGLVDLDWDGSADDAQEKRETRGRPRDTYPQALKALERLSQRQPRAYTTHEVKDELAQLLNTKPTQTVYLRAYQQLRKLYEEDRIDRLEKDWILKTVSQDELDAAAIEDLIG